MKRQRFRYSFGPLVPASELEGTLSLALIAAEGLHGEAQLPLDASHVLAADRSACVIEVRGQAGHDFQQIVRELPVPRIRPRQLPRGTSYGAPTPGAGDRSLILERSRR